MARRTGGVHIVTIVPTPEQADVIAEQLRSFRVAAGAGTGKTTTMAMRVVALVESHGIAPEQVLGITFTNKAAGELSERISAWLGDDDPGREVEVHTYHGFASQILREFGALVGVERDTKLVTPTFARQILADVVRVAEIRTWDLSNIHNIDRIASFSGQLGDHLLTPSAVVVPDIGADDVWAKRADLLSVLRLYEAEKRRMGVADYGDLITSAWKVCSEFPEVAVAIAERYRAIVLDEYQDTNPAQRELLRTIFAGRVPVTAVGDADQTIYEWRGASLQNFADFGSHFPNGDEPSPSLPLTTNRRSGSVILSVANRIKEELGPDPDRLVAVDGTPPGRVATAWFGTAAEEAAWIAQEIGRLHDEGLRWRDCAVLFRKNKDMQMIHDALSRQDVPFEVANLGGLLSVPEVSDLVAWLRILAYAEDSVALVRILQGSRFRLGLADLARVSDWVRERRNDIEDDIEGLPDYTLLEALDHLDEIAGLRHGARQALEQFHTEHTTLLRAAQGLSLVELCRTILDLTGAWQDIEAMSNAAGLSARLNLFRFLDLTESWSPLEGRPSLGAFTNYLDLMADNPREELDTARVSDADAVTLITVHRAKGLEWEAVFLPAAYKENFPAKYRGDDPYTSADILPFEFRLDRDALPDIDAATDKSERTRALRERHDDAEWRLAYVAVTRARQYLTTSGAWWYGHPIPLQRTTTPSPLFDLCRDIGVAVHDTPVAPDRPSRAAYRSSADAPDPGLDGGWAHALRRTLEDPSWPRSEASRRGLEAAYDATVAVQQDRLFALPDPPTEPTQQEVVTSATGLVTYATCPRRYQWAFVDPLPRRASDAARRGTDVHRRIELHNLGVVPLTEMTEATYDLTPDGDEPAGDPFRTFEQSRYSSVSPLLTEVPFELHCDSGRVRGRIDAVYPSTDEGWEIVDFKSGRDRPDGANLVQLQTYALAAADAGFGVAPPVHFDVSFVYLGGPEPVVRLHTVDEEWLDDAARRVNGLLDAIGRAEWPTSPSDACRSCDFLRFCADGRQHLSST
jgi:DNA helicase II / ATP-dependent DNA helicase PcrA